MAAESEEIDSENWLFESKLKECRSKLPDLISRRQFNDHRKSVSHLQEEIRSRMAKEMDGALFSPSTNSYTLSAIGDILLGQSKYIFSERHVFLIELTLNILNVVQLLEGFENQLLEIICDSRCHHSVD